MNEQGSLNIGIVVLVAAISMGTFFITAKTAQACTPVPTGWGGINLSDTIPEKISQDGIVAFSAVAGEGAPGYYELDVEVRDNSGQEVSGATEMIELGAASDLPSWIDCPGEGQTDRRYLIVWRADDDLTHGQEYEFEVTAEYSVLGDGQGEATETQIATFTVDEMDTSELLTAPTIVAQEVVTEHEGHDFECCSCDRCCGLCPEDDQQHCWYVSENWNPRITVDVEQESMLGEHRLLYRVLDDNGVVQKKGWRVPGEIGVTYPYDYEGPYCLTVEMEDLGSGDVEQSEEVCGDNSNNLEFGEKALDPSWPEDLCDSNPVDEADENSVADAGSTNYDTTDEPGGCQTTPGGGLGAGGLFFLFSILGIRLKVIARQNRRTAGPAG